MRQLILENRREPTVPVIRPELNEEQFEEGNYSRTVSHLETQVVRRNNLEMGIGGKGCKYKDFMAAKPPSLFGSPNTTEITDWIFEMEMVFESSNYNNKQRITLTV